MLNKNEYVKYKYDVVSNNMYFNVFYMCNDFYDIFCQIKVYVYGY